MPRAAVLLAAPLLVVSLSACSDDPNSIAAQAKSGNQQGYISGDGNVETIAAADRKKPIALTGTTLDNKQWSSQDVVGKVAVLNLWASWCPPCETEAPELKKAAEAIAAAKKPVAFMGINYRDNPDSGRSTAAAVGHPVPVARRPGRHDHPCPAGQGHLAADHVGAGPHRTDRRPGQRPGQRLDAHAGWSTTSWPSSRTRCR